LIRLPTNQTFQEIAINIDPKDVQLFYNELYDAAIFPIKLSDDYKGDFWCSYGEEEGPKEQIEISFKSDEIEEEESEQQSLVSEEEEETSESLSTNVVKIGLTPKLVYLSIRFSQLILRNISVSGRIGTVPQRVLREMRWRCSLRTQSCCNLLKINLKYTNSHYAKAAKPVTPFGNPSGTTISFPQKSKFDKLHGVWFSKFGLL
jgi:hypothetical protein